MCSPAREVLSHFFFFPFILISLSFLFCIEVYLINKQCCGSFRWTEKDSAIHMHVSIPPQTFIHPGSHITLHRAPYTVGPCWLSIFTTAVSACSPPGPILLPLLFSTGNHKVILWVCKSLSVFISSLYQLFLGSAYKGCHIFLLLCLNYFTQYDTL